VQMYLNSAMNVTGTTEDDFGVNAFILSRNIIAFVKSVADEMRGGKLCHRSLFMFSLKW